MKTEQYIATFPAPLFSVFRNWLHTGWISQGAAMGSEGAVPPIHGTLGQFVTAYSDLSNGADETPVREFLDQRVHVRDGQQVTVREPLRDALTSMSGWLIDMAVDRLEDAHWDDQRKLKTLGRQKLLEQGGEQFIDSLMATLDAEVGHLRLVDLFRRRRHEVGFASWSTHSAEMLLGARQVGRIPAGRLYLDMNDGPFSGTPVEAIEWVAGVREHEAWAAMISGMVYVFKPSCKNGSRSQLLLQAADEVSGGDHERVQAFICTQPNAEEVLGKGDIAFLWEWERRHGTSPGTGLESLAAVCEHLRRRHERLSSIVIAISPERFTPRTANEPLVIAKARLADLEKLRTYVLTIGERLGLRVFVAVSEQNDISREPETVRHTF